jgi:glycosidase
MKKLKKTFFWAGLAGLIMITGCASGPLVDPINFPVHDEPTTVPLAEIDFGDYSFDEYTASPDWRSQIIYFLVTDRFADGDPTNNDLGYGEYQPEDIEFYHGGDLQGLAERLDYIVATGSTAIWLTPQVANQWLSPAYSRRGTRYGGYHGYWAQDFYAVDPHLGSLNDYRVFVREAHARGLSVIQDIVPNHMGDYYTEEGAPNDPPGIPPAPAFPFDDPSRASEFFHFGGDDIYTTGFAGLLDDLNTESPYVIESLIEIFKWWIKETDIDGYRIDTVKYIPMAFWERFIPEIRAYAASLGKEDFLIFGEAYDYDNIINKAFDASDEKTASYTGTEEAPLFNSMLDFSITGAIHEVFLGKSVNASGSGELSPFRAISERYSSRTMGYYTQESAWQRVNFIDNHDMARWMYTQKSQRRPKQPLPGFDHPLHSPRNPSTLLWDRAGFQSAGGHQNFLRSLSDLRVRFRPSRFGGEKR